MTSEQIRTTVPEIKTSKELLFLLNAVKKDIYGDKCHPFSLKLITYYCNPARATKAYKHFKIAKKSGGFREISAPTKSLNSILTCLNVIFQALYEPSSIAKGFLPGKSVVDNAALHVGMNYIFNTDIKDFFPSINQARIWAVLQLKPLNFTKEAANLIAGLCCMRVKNEAATCEKDKYKFVLPQGSPASPILTNIVCQKLDHRLQGLAKRFELNCSRYADDITFSSSHNVYQKDGQFMKELQRIIEDQNFEMNVGKTRLQTKSMRQEVTGLVVSDKLNVTRQYTRDLGSMLYIWERYGLDAAFARFVEYYGKNKPCNKIGGPEFFIKVVKGKLMFMKMVKGEEDTVFKKLMARFDKLTNMGSKDSELVYSISNFEKEFHTRVEFTYKKDKEHTEENLIATTRFDKKNIVLIVSKKSRAVIQTFLTGKSELTWPQLKNKFHVVRKEDESGKPIWFIMNGNPRLAKTRVVIDIDDFLLEAEGGSQDEAKPVNEQQSASLDTVLKQLVSTNFSDLSILSQWDKTKKN